MSGNKTKIIERLDKNRNVVDRIPVDDAGVAHYMGLEQANEGREVYRLSLESLRAPCGLMLSLNGPEVRPSPSPLC